MNKNKLQKQRENIFPYHESPGINFFQYPPMQPVSKQRKIVLEKKLVLTTPQASGSTFTIFISIPYCTSRCRSCPYFKGLLPTRGDIHVTLDEYVDCLIFQMEKYAKTSRFSKARCDAIYFGGGTASLLFPDHVTRLVATLRKIFHLNPETEITLEGNPRQLTREYLQEVKKSGINRISIGYQSGNDAILKIVGTAHNATEAVQAARNAQEAGFKTVNVDLLYRVPGQTFKQWKQDIQYAINFNVSGISTYEYIIYPDTTMERLVERKILPPPIDKDIAFQWYIYTRELMQKNGYEEDRKGGFSKPDHRQMYGALSYDQGCEIIGLGAGAYSFINGYQFQTPNDPHIYKEQIHKGRFAIADRLSVRATEQNLMERFVIFSLFSHILNRPLFHDRFGLDPLTAFPDAFEKLKKYDLVEINPNEVRLTDLGIRWRSNVFYEFYAKDFKNFHCKKYE